MQDNTAEINKLKKELYTCIEESDNLTDERVVKKSQELDRVLNMDLSYRVVKC